jgi:membrane fusion protein (multidrug efflux system)
MTNSKKKSLIGVGVVAIALVAYLVVTHLMVISTDNAQVHAHTVLIAPKVSGFVAKVNVVEGQEVKEGEVLVEIDERDFQNALRQVRGDLTSIEARTRDADRSFKRISSLFSSGAVSQQQFDTASTAFSEANAKLEAVRAQVAQAELNVENTKIKAPSDGFIARRSVEVGQLAGAGTPLIGFVDGRERWIEANFKETDIADLKIGAKVDVSIDAVPGKDFHGKVQSVSAATGSTFTLLPPDNATGNFTKVVQRVPVKIVLEQLSAADTAALRAGLSAVVHVYKN